MSKLAISIYPSRDIYNLSVDFIHELKAKSLNLVIRLIPFTMFDAVPYLKAIFPLTIKKK